MKSRLQLATALLLLGLTARLAAVATPLTPSGGDDTATIQGAINALGDAGGMVELGEGTFNITSQISIVTAVTLKGAGRDKTTVRQTTKLSKAPCSRVFWLNHANAVLSGITITGGYTYNLGTTDSENKHSGAGVLIDAAGGQIIDCRVTGNEPSMNDYGAVHLVSANGKVIRTIIDNNRNTNAYPYSGVGLTMTAGHVESCLIANNYANGASRKTTSEAGGVSISGGELVNCTIVGNKGWNVGGLEITSSSAKVINCLVVDNALSGSGATIAGAPDCINTKGADVATCSFTRPAFKNATDYHIVSSDPTIDAGSSEVVTFQSATDLDGQPRVYGSAPDIGCYESPGTDDWIDIAGTPEPYGVVTPAYGQKDGLKTGDEIACSASSGEDSATCTGYQLLNAAGDVVDSGTTSAFTYVHDGTYRKLVWLWQASFTLTATAGPGGTVTTSGTSASYGDTLTVTATPDTKLTGVSFWRWTGDVPEANRYDNPLTLTMDGDKSVTAVFGTKRAYVAPSESPSSKPAFPYASEESAANSLAEAFAVTSDGGEIVCGAGTFALGDELTVDRPVAIRGSGDAVSTLDLAQHHFYLKDADARLEGFKVIGTRIEWNATGGGVNITAGTVAQCRFYGNVDNNGISAKGFCAGVCGASARMTHCVFENNDASARNTIGILGVTAGLVDNCLFVSNKCQQGGAVYMTGGTLRNCTIVDNAATTGKAGGVYADANWGPVLENTIVYNNTAQSSGNNFYFTGSSDVQKNHYAINSCFGKDLSIGQNPVVGDPTLDASHRLAVGSVGIDAGNDYTGVDDDTDLGGDKRKVGDHVDLGCYEYVPSKEFACTIKLSKTNGLVGDSVTLSALIGDEFNPDDYTFNWTVTDAGGSVVSSPVGQSVSMTFDQASRYTVELTVNDAKEQVVFSGEAKSQIYILPAVVYLAPANDGAAFPYDTEATAATNLIELAALLVDGCTVVVLPGEHRVNAEIEITHAITIRGRDGRDATTIRQTAQKRVFVLNDAGASLEGLTIAGGYANSQHGAGVRIDGKGGLVKNCRITGCLSAMNASGALSLSSDKARATATLIVCNTNNNNYGNCPGVGISAGAIDSCLVADNVITDCSMRKFAVPGGISISGGTVSNCTVTANYGHGVGGISFYDGFNWQGGSVVNTISYGNTATPEYTPEASKGDVNRYCDNASKMINNCFEDPKFVDATGGDYHLDTTGSVHDKGAASPAVNAGVYGPWMSAATDLDGKPRVKRSRREASGEVIKAWVDLGCYESTSTAQGVLLLIK